MWTAGLLELSQMFVSDEFMEAMRKTMGGRICDEPVRQLRKAKAVMGLEIAEVGVSPLSALSGRVGSGK